jgi:uncharacterized membrane protein YfhO
VVIEDRGLLAVKLTTGQHRNVVQYLPPYFWCELLLLLQTFLAIATGFLWLRNRSRW